MAGLIPWLEFFWLKSGRSPLYDSLLKSDFFHRKLTAYDDLSGVLTVVQCWVCNMFADST